MPYLYNLTRFNCFLTYYNLLISVQANLLDQAYDKFSVSLENMELMLALRGEHWREAIQDKVGFRLTFSFLSNRGIYYAKCYGVGNISIKNVVNRLKTQLSGFAPPVISLSILKKEGKMSFKGHG